MVHLKDTVIYGEVQFDSSSTLTLYNIPKVNNLPILLEEDLENDLFVSINNYHETTQANLTALKTKSTIGGASGN